MWDLSKIFLRSGLDSILTTSLGGGGFGTLGTFTGWPGDEGAWDVFSLRLALGREILRSGAEWSEWYSWVIGKLIWGVGGLGWSAAEVLIV